MTTIAYDRPVKNFIEGLNKTGHVTHTKHRKKSVTLHHNGGRLSLEGILEVWKTRPASAHFQCDGRGNVGQYVLPNEYAWASGTTNGNKESIHIEMANSTLAPNWGIAEATWKSAARLAGWLFAKVIGERPTRNNLKVHKDWKPTICAGPYVDKMYNDILRFAQASYDYFTGKSSKPPVKTPAPQPTPKKSVSTIASEVLAGRWGNGDERKRRLTAAGYNYSAVQAEVNRRLAGGAPSAHKPTFNEVVQEVIRGEWGNGATRKQRLRAAGFNPELVQAEVNRRLR